MSDFDLEEQMRRMKEKRDEQIKEIEKMYDKCLRMHIQLAKNKLDLINMWKLVESQKLKEQNAIAAILEAKKRNPE